MQDKQQNKTIIHDARGDGPDTVVRVGPLLGMVPVLRELVADPDALFEGSGFTTAEFEDPDTELLYRAGSRLLARCVEATQCPHLGLLIGARAVPSSLGITGFMLRSAPNVGAALRDLVEYLDLHDQGGVPTLFVQADATQLGYAIHQSGVEAVDLIYDVSIAFACNIMRSLCGEDWKPTEVMLSRRPPPELAPYQRFYRAPLRFNADRNALEFPSRWLEHTVQTGDPLLHRYLEREANELKTIRHADIVSNLRGLLRKLLKTRKCTIGVAAKQLCMHERSLHRKLREHGTSFQRELDNVRYEKARALLANSAMPIARIATALNYTDASAFNRAFKRWTGMSPARWRDEKKAPS